MHRSTGLQGKNIETTHSISWDGTPSVDEWLKTQPVDAWKQQFAKDGFLVVKDILNEDEVTKYLDIYNRMINNEIDASEHRHDLGNHVDNQTKGTENIMQIMWPSLYVNGLDKGPLHHRANAVSRVILGEDMEFDFDMLLNKGPHTNSETPWHQDESYWLDMPDKRAVTCWCALENVTADSGCMWFVRGSHLHDLRQHRAVKEGCHVRMCDGSEEEGEPQPLKGGSCTFHSGRTMHYTRGNSTANHRRAYATNFRPKAMVEYERSHAFDHGKTGLKEILKD